MRRGRRCHHVDVDAEAVVVVSGGGEGGWMSVKGLLLRNLVRLRGIPLVLVLRLILVMKKQV